VLNTDDNSNFMGTAYGFAGNSGPIPADPPEYGRFQTLLASLQWLRTSNGLEISRKRKLVPVYGPISVEALQPSEIRAAEDSGYAYEPTESGESVVLNKVLQTTILRFSEEAVQSPDGRTVFDMLGLDPDEREFELKLALGGLLPSTDEPHGKRKQILIMPRSLQQIRSYLSKGVQVPQDHREKGIVRFTRNFDNTLFNWHPVVGCFCVRHSRHKPDDAAVCVPYRGYWFYVDDRDVNSKRTLMLLDQIVASQVDFRSGADQPVLTLPL